MTQIETLYKMRDKALHRYTISKSKKRRADEEHNFCVQEISTINRLIAREKDDCKLTMDLETVYGQQQHTEDTCPQQN